MEFARTDCGSSSRSSTGLDAGVEANTPVVMGGNGDRHEGAGSSGEQGTQDFGAVNEGGHGRGLEGAGSSGEAEEAMAGETVGEMAVKEFFAMVDMAAENGGFVPICGGVADSGKAKGPVRGPEKNWGHKGMMR